MQHIILKHPIEQEKMSALMAFLKSLNIDAEIKEVEIKKISSDIFSLTEGLWKDYDIDAKSLRNKAWSK